jgi:hypothetical protein
MTHAFGYTVRGPGRFSRSWRMRMLTVPLGGAEEAGMYGDAVAFARGHKAAWRAGGR